MAIQFLQVEKFVSDLSGVNKHKKKTEFWAHITTVIAMKNLFKTLETYLFSVSGARVQNPMSSLNILVETRIPLMDSDNPQYIG